MENHEEEQNLEQVKAKVQQKFNEVRAALHMREKLLLRQLEVIASTQQQQQMLKDSSKVHQPGEVRFVSVDEEEELMLRIRGFGRFQLDNMQLALQDVYLRNEDYIAPVEDHETMYKCLQDGKIAYYDLEEEAQPEAIVVDFSRNKSLVEDNAKLMNKSIINITLQEAKELIRKAKLKRDTYIPPLNLEELDDELESSIADAVSSLGREPQPAVPPAGKPKSRKPRFKPKITINNCNGTINLRNIASLTINCANEEAVSAEIPLAMPTPTANKLQQSADSSSTTEEQSTTASSSNSNYSSNASSRSQSKKQKCGKKAAKQPHQPQQQQKCSSSSMETTPTPTQPTSSNSQPFADVILEDETTHDVTCDFYNRLLNEIKRSLKEKPIRAYDQPPASTMTTTTTTTTAVTSTQHNVVQAAAADSTCDANSNRPAAIGEGSSSATASASTVSTASTLSSHIQPGKRLILKNFENLKIILEANSGDEDSFHPVQIEQWLTEIISETDLEPMQQTDILEHSKINNSESN